MAAIEEAGRPESTQAAQHRHAWGTVSRLTSTESAAAEQITVAPDHEMHMERGVWVVMEGEARSGDSHLVPGDVLTVPAGDRIRLSNPSNELVVLIRVRPLAE